MKILNKKLFRDLKSLKMQIFTMSILMICGLSVLISSWSSYQSLMSARDLFYQNFEFAEIFSEVSRAPSSVVHQLIKIDGIKRIESRIVKDILIDVVGQSEPAMGRLVSWNDKKHTINKIYIRKGRMPEKSKQTTSSIEGVVHEAFAEAHKLRVGDFINANIGGKKHHIFISGIGLSPEFVYSVSPIAPLPDDKHFGVLWIRQDEIEKLLDMVDSFNSIQVLVSAGASINFIKQQLDIILKPYGSIQSYDRSQQSSNLFVQGEIKEQKVLAFFMPTIFLSVAIFILNIVLSRLIAKQRAQIATLKALGYNSFSLFIHYFELTTIILLLGILPAFFVGYWLGQVYTHLYENFFRFPKIDFQISIVTTLITLSIGLISGWISSLGVLINVFSLQPAEALRPFCPPNLSRRIIDRFSILKPITSYSKMIVRSLLMRPLRFFLSVLGIAVSLAILINGSFFNDVIDFMLNRQFERMNREDLTLRLTHPEGFNLFSELRSIPGVLMVEGERTISVTLTYKNYKKDINLLGRNSDAQLNRVVDQNGKLIVPKSGGVLLSRYFEKKFKLKVGDLVNFNQLSEKQNKFEAPVSGFVDDLMGQQAYCLKTDLHRWLGEMSLSNKVHLKINPSYSQSIYITLKQRPNVSSVTVHHLMLKGIIDIMAETMTTFTRILYIFAVSITIAVLYNTARVSFSERGWELASLRILGFDVKSTFEILFFELSILVLIALIPGLILGYALSLLSTRLIDTETFMFPIVINPTTYASSLLAILLTLFASGIFLYQKVYHLDLSEALKSRE